MEDILSDIKYLAIYTAELSKIYNDSKRFFITLEPGETEINRKTEDFLWELMFKPEPVEVEDLESWLNYTMEKESIITTMMASVQ
jgi:hypothetical protein